MGKLLGEGAFGMVFMAEAEGIAGQPGNSVVAVKMLKGMTINFENVNFQTRRL